MKVNSSVLKKYKKQQQQTNKQFHFLDKKTNKQHTNHPHHKLRI